MSLTSKVAAFTFALCLMVISGITFLSYRISHSELEKSIGVRLEAIVRSGAAEIDGTMHDRIKTNEDVDGPEFQLIRDQLRRLKTANDLDSAVYTLRRVGEHLEFVVMTNEKPFVGDHYEIKRPMLPTLNDGEPNHSGVYSDTHGEWISAYAPIFDQEGRISGLLEADVRVETFLASLHEKFKVLLVKGAGFVLFAVIMSWVLARTVTRRIVYLTELTEKISLGKINKKIEVKGRDEVASLGASLERMRESLIIAADMIQ